MVEDARTRPEKRRIWYRLQEAVGGHLRDSMSAAADGRKEVARGGGKTELVLCHNMGSGIHYLPLVLSALRLPFVCTAFVSGHLYFVIVSASLLCLHVESSHSPGRSQGWLSLSVMLGDLLTKALLL